MTQDEHYQELTFSLRMMLTPQGAAILMLFVVRGQEAVDSHEIFRCARGVWDKIPQLRATVAIAGEIAARDMAKKVASDLGATHHEIVKRTDGTIRKGN